MASDSVEAGAAPRVAAAPAAPVSGALAAGRMRRLPVRLATIVIALVGVAIAVRIAYVLLTPSYVASGDAHSYDGLARSLAAGHGWAGRRFGWAWRAPGYPFFLAGIYDLVGLPHGADVTSARIVQAVFGAVTVVLVGVLARELWGRTAMLVSLGLAAIYLPLAVVGDSLMSEALFTPLDLAATVCAVRSRRGSRRYLWVVAAGLLAGLASLSHSNGLILAPVLIALVWGREPGVRRVVPPLLLVLVMAATISPWTIRNASKLHAFIPVSVETGPTLAGTYNDRAALHDWRWQLFYPGSQSIAQLRLTGAERDREDIATAFRYIRKHPLSVVEVTYWNTVRLLDLGPRSISRKTANTDLDASAGMADAMVYEFWALGALAIVGIVGGALRGTPARLWLVPLVLWLSVALVTTGTPRFRSALEPFVLVLAATGVLFIWREARDRIRGRGWAALAGATAPPPR